MALPTPTTSSSSGSGPLPIPLSALKTGTTTAPAAPPASAAPRPVLQRVQGHLGTWLLTLFGIALVVLLSAISSKTWSKNLPSPGLTPRRERA